jgi:c-di-GMP-related signal transduction protein
MPSQIRSAQNQQEESVSVLRSPYRFVVRQPILSVHQLVFGYELLFRDGLSACIGSSGPEPDPTETLDTTSVMGFDLLCNGTLAFIPCTRDALLRDYMTLLPPSQTVVELPVDLIPSEVVILACQRLKDAGYQIALTGFTLDDPREPLTPFASILKVDFHVFDIEKNTNMVRKYGKLCRMLADKLESQEDFIAAKQIGFSYFQGSFFRKPDVLPVTRNSVNSLKYFKMFEAASRPELNPTEIERLIESEPSVAYRLLRYLNSSLFSFADKITSVRQALAMMGMRETRRWLRLTATLGAGQDKPSVLVLSALVRARFCELTGPRILHSEADLFLMGILSLMDAILELPMSRVVEGLPLSEECSAALLGKESRLAPVYRLMLCQETGDWGAMKALAEDFHVAESDIANDHLNAIKWAQELIES